ncbi:sensor histidine kinase [Peribacillus alkalitolerans]|uniref:sensor histidine kinase n=1 Tax=Peribacillus alkalitolerans TaxID=1550385 RepID=UPI001F081B5C|nr:sensor histidine kinase [Peribacillus alkalitolerans]
MKGLRSFFFQSYMMFALISSLVFFVIIQMYILLAHKPVVSLTAAIWLSALVLGLLLSLAAYFGIRNAYILKRGLCEVNAFIQTLRSGRLSERITKFDSDELGALFKELNELADYIQEHVRSIQRLAEEKAKLAQSAQAAAVLEERQRIARELHDAVSQQLFALNMMSATTLKTFDDEPDQTKQVLQEISSISMKAQSEMRALLLHLRPIELSEDSLSDGIIKLLKELRDKTNMQFQVSIDDVFHLSKSAEMHIFRIVQEAVTNVIRHAEATKIQVELSECDCFVQLYIRDNGIGFNPFDERMASYGIRSMKERTDEMGGVFQLRSKQDEGTYLLIKIPFKAGERDGSHPIGSR